MKQVEQKIMALTEQVIEEMGYELADVELIEEMDGLVLTLYIHQPSGVTLDDCEKVSRVVDPIIEENDPLPDTYILSVSSLGLDRPFKKQRDYERVLGTEIEVHLYAPINKKKKWVGILQNVTDEKIVLDVDGEIMEVTYQKIAKASPMIRF